MRRWPAFLLVAAVLLLAGWLTGNVFFTHPVSGSDHPESLADLQYMPETQGPLGLICLFGLGGTLVWLTAWLRPRPREEKACRFFCGWHTSAYDGVAPLRRLHLTPDPGGAGVFV